ncbi:MAG: glycosyltransferase family 2 protein [Synergistaceae bacterium]|nr:glycosyltransferase family 2 protein [Synergistaceae bacterium]
MISIICPCYNEEKSLPLFIQAITETISTIPETFELLFVNDGSTDSTLELLRKYSEHDSRIKVVDFSRNFGKEAALTAGLDYSSGDAVIPIDADLQDSPELIAEMILKWHEGYEVVLAHRADRSTDSFPKRFTARMFYKFHNMISIPHIPENVGDFRLMDRAAVNALKECRESCRFMKGLFAWAGFRTFTLDYRRDPRSAGQAKFNGWKLWSLALEGITSFSTAPLTIWLYLGAAIAFSAFVYLAHIFVRTLIFGVEVPGYASIVCLILFFGGLNLIGIGLIGQYLGRTYIESKHRPIYIVRKVYGGTNEV